MSGPVDVMGVVAFPNENGKRDCRFIDTDYNTLFTVPDGENIVVNYGYPANSAGKSVLLYRKHGIV